MVEGGAGVVALAPEHHRPGVDGHPHRPPGLALRRGVKAPLRLPRRDDGIRGIGERRHQGGARLHQQLPRVTGDDPSTTASYSAGALPS